MKVKLDKNFSSSFIFSKKFPAKITKFVHSQIFGTGTISQTNNLDLFWDSIAQRQRSRFCPNGLGSYLSTAQSLHNYKLQAGKIEPINYLAT